MLVSTWRVIACWAAVPLLLGANCSRNVNVGPDETPEPDAGALTDAGPTDAGETPDSGAPHDASIPVRGVIPPDAGRPGFSFLSGTSEADVAMAALWSAGLESPETQQQAAAHALTRRQAQATLHRNLPQVQARLGEALDALGPEAANEHLSLLPLLKAAGDSPALLGRLLDLMMAPPRPTLVGNEDNPDQTVRWVAATATFHLAQHGSAAARQNILSAVQAGDDYVRRLAVRHTYALNADRRVAQRLMRPLLPCEQRHILYEE
ncbi:MAG: hypothetical protein HY904_07665 [Deltaproteobacteria bacterium]|nr:hypothetical protein [Deltaproteobacteria bacterium]